MLNFKKNAISPKFTNFYSKIFEKSLYYTYKPFYFMFQSKCGLFEEIKEIINIYTEGNKK